MPATPFAIRELQRACNDCVGRYRLGQPHLPVDGVYGSSTDKLSKWLQWVIGIADAQIGKWPLDTVIVWLASPQKYYASHPGGLVRHRQRLKALRTPVVSGGLVVFDGAHVAAWIAPILTQARSHGWGGTIPDKTYGGFRSYGMQAELFREYNAGGGIAASPDLPSNHQGKTWPAGAVDCSDNDRLDTILGGMGSDLGRQGGAPSQDPVHFSSRRHYRDSGHY